MDIFKQTRKLALPVLTVLTYASMAFAAGHDVEAAAPHGGGPEMTPLVPNPGVSATWMSALWVVIIFVVVLAVLYPTAWKAILGSLKQREERIRGEIANAEAARAKAEETLRQYNDKLASAEAQMRDILNKAAIDAEKIATELKMKANKEVEEIKNRSTREIEEAKKQAIIEIHQQTAEISTQIAAKILGRVINVDDQRELVKQSLQQLGNIN